MNMNDRMKRDAALKRRLDILANQQEMYTALYDATRSLPYEDDLGRRGDVLLIQLSREIVLNCEQLWELSGQDRLPPEQGTTPAQEDTDAPKPF